MYHMTKVYTAQFRYGGSDRFDSTAKEKTVVSPPWWLVKAYQSGTMDAETYKDKYYEFLDYTRETRKSEWSELLHRYEVTLVCYCRKGDFCHRLLAANYLEKLGAEYCGER